ncbi:MAG: ATP-binding protein [Magnetospirillum sp. WYHS-4]
MTHRLEVRLANELPEIGRLMDEVKKFGESCSAPPPVVFDFTLAFDELLTNTITYGFEADSRHEIVVRLAVEGDHLVGEIRDDGKAFNPLEIPDPDLSLDIDERPIGGLGVFFVRKVMDRVDYRREDGFNIITLRKALSGAGSQDGE